MFNKEQQKVYLNKKRKIAQITLEETLSFCKKNREDVVIVTLDSVKNKLHFKVIDIRSFKLKNNDLNIKSFRTLTYEQRLVKKKNTPIDNQYLKGNFSPEIIDSIDLQFFDKEYLISPGFCEYSLDYNKFLDKVSADNLYTPLQYPESFNQIYKLASVFLPSDIGNQIIEASNCKEEKEYSLTPIDYSFNNEETIEVNTIVACFSEQISHAPYFNMLSYNDAEALDLAFVINYLEASKVSHQEIDPVNKEDFYLPDLPYILNLNSIINNFIKKTSLSSYSSIYRNEALSQIDDGVINKGEAPSALALYNNACLVNSHLSFLVNDNNYKLSSFKDLEEKLAKYKPEANQVNPSLISVENFTLDPLASIYNLLLGQKVLTDINQVAKSYFSLLEYKTEGVPFKESLNNIIEYKGFNSSIYEPFVYTLNPQYSLSHFSPLYPIELFHAPHKHEKEPLYTLNDEVLKVFLKELIEDFSIRYFKLYTIIPSYLSILNKLEEDNKVAMLAAYVVSRCKAKLKLLHNTNEQLNDRRYSNYYKNIKASSQEEIKHFKNSFLEFYGHPLSNYDNFNCDYSYNYLYNLIHNSYHYRESALPLYLLPGAPACTTQASSPQSFLSFLSKDKVLEPKNFDLLSLKLENLSLKEFFAHLFKRMQQEVWEESDLFMNLNETTLPEKFAPEAIRKAPNRGFNDYFAQSFTSLEEPIKSKRDYQLASDSKLPYYHLFTTPESYHSYIVNSAFAFMQNRIYCGALSTKNPSYTAEGYCAEVVRNSRFVSIMIPYASIIDISYEDKINIFNVKSPNFGLSTISPAASILSSNTLFLNNSPGIDLKLKLLKSILGDICLKIYNQKLEH